MQNDENRTKFFEAITLYSVFAVSLLIQFGVPKSVHARYCSPVYGQFPPVSVEAYVNGGGLSIDGARCELLAPHGSAAFELPFCVAVPESYCEEQLEEVLKTRSALVAHLKKDRDLPEFLLAGVIITPSIRSPEIRFIEENVSRLKVALYLPFPGKELKRGRLKDSGSGMRFIDEVIQSPETLPDQIQNLLSKKIALKFSDLANQAALLSGLCKDCEAEAKRISTEMKRGLLPYVVLKEVGLRRASVEDLARLGLRKTTPQSRSRYQFLQVNGDILSLGGFTFNFKRCLVADKIVIAACEKDLGNLPVAFGKLLDTLSPSEFSAFSGEYLQFIYEQELAAELEKRRQLGLKPSQGVMVERSRTSDGVVENYISFEYPIPNCATPRLVDQFSVNYMVYPEIDGPKVFRVRCTVGSGQSVEGIRAAFQKFSNEKSAQGIVQMFDLDGSPVYVDQRSENVLNFYPTKAGERMVLPSEQELQFRSSEGDYSPW